MKNLILLVFALTSYAAMAKTITLLDTKIPTSYYFYTSASSKFYMDTKFGQGYAKVNVTEYERDQFPRRDRCDRYGCYPAPSPIPRSRTLFYDTIEIENLKMVDKQMIYMGENGEINCGHLGTSRVLRRPTLYLSGNCKLNTRLNNGRLTVKLTIQ